MNNNTEYIKEEIEKCEDIEELKETVFPLIRTQQDEWKRKINAVISDGEFTKSRFAGLCGVSRVTVDNWCKGSIPKNRETFIKIGMAAGYSLDEINQLLLRYGRYPALYSKSLEDCICIYVIEHGYGEEAIEVYLDILSRIRERFIRSETTDPVTDITTVKFDAGLSEVNDENELERFIEDNISMFSNAYHRFYAYVKMFIEANYMEPAYADTVFEMAEIQGWSSSLRQCVSAIRQGKWYPTRNKIISLGLHLSMDHEQIDEMLSLAHMEPLCAKNIFESVIMFILDDASLNDILNSESEDYDPDELCEYARKILSSLDFPEIDDFISELPDPEDYASEYPEVGDDL
ncbi:hypothetical protein SAMN02910292_01542 [Lachnospiraceae bacterium XBB2008]|nr:hypothetical protein SAMN02910292_01542 [Lachnospiraceae bacterium XBB2008]